MAQGYEPATDGNEHEYTMIWNTEGEIDSPNSLPRLLMCIMRIRDDQRGRAKI